MAEAAEQTETPEPEDEVPVVEPATDEPEKEPGGASPEDVRARKEYRTRRRVEGELMAEREARIRLEEQLNAARQQQERVAEKPVYTAAQVQAEMDSGALPVSLGTQYLARMETERAIREDRAREAARRPVEAAIARIGEYREVLDWTNDRTHPNFIKARVKFRELVARGSPANEATELTALEFVAGDLETVRRKNEMREATRAGARPAAADASGGPAPVSGKVDATKAPASMQEYWNETKLPQKSREREYQIYLDLQRSRRVQWKPSLPNM